ncbi:hypothetical protein BGY98DRAFT_704997 [Russula aff. rugulosa BPL654]|nr:hypothetical protein BGY98DRAFT_704997 [Russula aff. rugulosa BPL654]
MRRYNIVSGILLILPIIDFALAAPLLVREKSRAYVDVAHIPEDMVTVLGERGEEIEKLAEGYLKTLGNPVDSSGAHASSSLAPSEPDHQLTNVVSAPPPNSAPSTTNLDHALVEPSSPSSAVLPVHEVEGGSEHAGPGDQLHGPLPAPASSEVGLDQGLTEAHTPQLNPNPGQSTDSEFDWEHWNKVVNPPPAPKPAPSTGSRFNWKNNLKNLVNLKDTPPSGPPSSQPSNEKPSTGLGINWKNNLKNLVNLKDTPQPGPPSSQPSNEKPSTGLGTNWKNNLKNLVNLKDTPQPGPPSSQPSNEKPSTGLGINWKNLINLKDLPLPGQGSQPSKQEPSTGLGIDWKNPFKNLANLKDAPAAPPPDQASSSQPWKPKPEPSTKSGLLGFTNTVIDLLGKLDPLPRPEAKPDSHWESWSPGPDWVPNSMSAPRRPLPSLKISSPNTEPPKEPGVEPINVIHEPPSSPDSELTQTISH